MTNRNPLTEEFIKESLVSIDDETELGAVFNNVLAIVRWTEMQHGIFRPEPDPAPVPEESVDD